MAETNIDGEGKVFFMRHTHIFICEAYKISFF